MHCQVVVTNDLDETFGTVAHANCVQDLYNDIAVIMNAFHVLSKGNQIVNVSIGEILIDDDTRN